MSCTYLIRMGLAGVLGAAAATAAGAADAPKSPFRKPVPTGVAEIRGIAADGSIVETANGALLLAQGESYRLSTDGGQTWGKPEPLNCKTGVAGMVRLKSGALGVYGTNSSGHCFSVSADEGKTWSEPTVICPSNAGYPMFRSMIQLKTGRLLFTLYWEGLDAWDYRDGTMVCVHPELQYLDVSAYGLWRGQKVQIEGHGHAPEMGMAMVYRSDDEGKTWKKHPGALMGWFDANGVVNGAAGITPCFEPTIVETKDGNVLLVARSTVGRLVASFSTDGGESWYTVKPMDLCSSPSPGMLAALPNGGDILIVWNQVSPEEIRRGFRRGRLSAAISQDGGHSWGHFRTLELSGGLEDVSRVPPEYPLQMNVRARDYVGVLPDEWAYFHYSNVDVVGDKVIIRYNRGTPLLGVAEQNLDAQESVMRIYPLSWFYE